MYKHKLKLYYNAKQDVYFIFNNTRYYLNDMLVSGEDRSKAVYSKSITNCSSEIFNNIYYILDVNDYITFNYTYNII